MEAVGGGGGATASSSSVGPGLKVESAVSVGEASEEEDGVRRNAAAGRRIDQLYVGRGGRVAGGGGGILLSSSSSGISKKVRRERVVGGLGCVTTAKDRISKMPPCAAGKRSSIYRGVTRHRWTGRYEAHLWDKSTWNQNQNKKGKQVYLGAYDDEEAAARAYDLAALKYWGAGTLINFPVSDYSRDLEEMQMISKEDYLVSLRRKSSAFSRGFPKYRGVSRQPQSSRWEAPFNQILGATRDAALERKYVGGLCMDRKIDLTSYIKWWGHNKPRQLDSVKTLEETHAFSEDFSKELRAFQCPKQPTEPYQLPSLGISHKVKPRASPVSARDILSRSDAFKNFQLKFSATQDGTCSKDISDGRAVPVLAGEVEKSGVDLGLNDLPLQRAPFPQPSLLSEPLRTSCMPVDSVPDPIFWTSLVPPTGLSLTPTIRKTESSSTYTYNCQE